MWDQTEDEYASYETEPTDYYGAIREEAVKIAEQELLKDTREIGANNRGPVVDVYLRNANALGKDVDPSIAGKGWCGMFVYYCYSEAAKKFGMSLPFHSGNLWRGSHLRKWSHLHPDKIVKQSPLLPGDIFIIGDNHMGIITNQIRADVYGTIDGNQASIKKNNEKKISPGKGVARCEHSYYKFDSLIRI